MRHRRQRAEGRRVADQNIELAEALVQAGTDRFQRPIFLQIQRQQRGLAAHGAHRVVGFRQPALAARGDHHMGAAPRQLHRHRRPQPPAGAGDQRNPSIQFHESVFAYQPFTRGHMATTASPPSTTK